MPCLGVAVLCLSLLIGGCPFRGPQGPEGPQGPQGEQGIQGPAGESGQDGLDAPAVPGPKGDDGDDGDRGPRGRKGDDGDDGDKGDKGDEGDKGDKGDKGDQGDPGQDFEPPAGTPTVETISDATGDPLVVGDLLDLTGLSLDGVDVVLVGDQVAPILSQDPGELRIQIPAGVAAGANTIRLINFTSDTGFVESLAAVNVHRLAVLLGAQAHMIVVRDLGLCTVYRVDL